jgi:hypothetical protein
MVRVKALGVLDCRNYITERYGAAAHDKIRTAMRPEDRDIVYSPDTLAVTWMDLNAVINHLLIFDTVIGNGDGKADEAMIRDLANRHFKGIYSIMFKSASPKDVVKKFAQIWNRYYDHGESEVNFVDDKNVLIKVLNCPGLPRYHERLVIPYLEELLRLCGAKDIEITQPECIATGAMQCLFKVSWT